MPETTGTANVTFYTVRYSDLEANVTRTSRVQIIDGYTTFEDIRKILAVMRGYGNGTDGVEKIDILSLIKN